MKITVKSKDDVAYVYIQGDIDIKSADQLGAELSEIAQIDIMNHVVINMKTVNSITSTGIGKIINFYKLLLDRRKTMEIKGVSETVYEQFLDIHLERIITIHKPYSHLKV